MMFQKWDGKGGGGDIYQFLLGGLEMAPLSLTSSSSLCGLGAKPNCWKTSTTGSGKWLIMSESRLRVPGITLLYPHLRLCCLAVILEGHRTLNMSSTSTSAKPHDELQYLNLIRDVLDTGESRPDRTGTGTISLFAPPSLRFSLANSTFPLLTTKKTFLRGIIEELLWFVKGQTDSTLLSKKGVKIWDGNGSKEFLEKRGLGHRRTGDLGPVYGFQWRHFGADYVDADTDYSGQGVDQLREVIRKIKEDPTDRRIIMSAWNPAGKSLDLPLHAMLQSLSSINRYTTYGTAALSHDVPILCPPAGPRQP